MNSDGVCRQRKEKHDSCQSSKKAQEVEVLNLQGFKMEGCLKVKIRTD